MLEWFKRHAWKACKLQKGFRGSNPRLSAKILLRFGGIAKQGGVRILKTTNAKLIKTQNNSN